MLLLRQGIKFLKDLRAALGNTRFNNSKIIRPGADQAKVEDARRGVTGERTAEGASEGLAPFLPTEAAASPLTCLDLHLAQII